MLLMTQCQLKKSNFKSPNFLLEINKLSKNIDVGLLELYIVQKFLES